MHVSMLLSYSLTSEFSLRAAIEVGRKQVIYFCACILDEQPDPTMLKEEDEDDEVEEDESDEEQEEERSSRKKRRKS